MDWQNKTLSASLVTRAPRDGNLFCLYPQEHVKGYGYPSSGFNYYCFQTVTV
jgi:hypothetical protein